MDSFIISPIRDTADAINTTSAVDATSATSATSASSSAPVPPSNANIVAIVVELEVACPHCKAVRTQKVTKLAKPAFVYTTPPNDDNKQIVKGARVRPLKKDQKKKERKEDNSTVSASSSSSSSNSSEDDDDHRMTWLDATRQAIERHVHDTKSRIFTKKEFEKSELDWIVAQTHSTGKTPDQTLSRVLQKDLRDAGKLKFLKKRGHYKWLG